MTLKGRREIHFAINISNQAYNPNLKNHDTIHKRMHKRMNITKFELFPLNVIKNVLINGIKTENMDRLSFTETQKYQLVLSLENKVTFPITSDRQEPAIGGIRQDHIHGADHYRPLEDIPISKRSISDPGPILVKCNNNLFWDLSRIDLKSILLPGTFLTDRSRHIVGLQLGQHISRILSQGTSVKEYDIAPLNAFQQTQYKLCKLKLLDYPAQFGFFDLVGSNLRRLLPEELVEELDSIRPQDYLLIKEGFINLQLTEEQQDEINRQVKINARDDAETVCNAQKYRYSQPDGIKGEKFVKATAPRAQGVLRKVLAELAQGGIQLQQAPEFIGYVPSEIANTLVGKSGFTDSNWSANFLHGKYSHLLALAFLSREARLTASTLNAIVTHNLWNDLLDDSPYAEIDIEQLGDHEYWIHDRNPFTCPFNPFAFQEMLCTGQISSTLRQISEILEGLPTDEYSMFTDAFQEPVTPERLLQMAQNIQLLEHIIALEHHNDIFDIKQHFTMPTFGLVPQEILEQDDGWTLGQFTDLKQSDELKACAAMRAFQRGDKVVGISKYYEGPLCQIFGCVHFSQREIRKVKDFEVEPAFTSYIVWPAQRVPAHKTSKPGYFINVLPISLVLCRSMGVLLSRPYSQVTALPRKIP